MNATSNMAARAAAADAAGRPQADRYVTEEQFLYADLLDKGMKVGLAMLLVSFAVYVFGLSEPVVPLADLPAYWSLPVGKYLAKAGIGTGWSWLGLVARGDFMNFAGIAFLSTVTIVCYVRILAVAARTRQTIFGGIVLAEILVLCLGASGILTAGH